MSIVQYPHEILKTPTVAFDFDDPIVDPIELAHLLAQGVIEHNGLGISANQLGLGVSVCAIKAEQVIVMFNPKIVHYSDEQVYAQEGCLSSPNLFIKIKRPASIRVRFTLPNGETTTSNFIGMTARVIQHEIDHLSGKFFAERANRYHLEAGRKLQKKLNKDQEVIAPGDITINQ